MVPGTNLRETSVCLVITYNGAAAAVVVEVIRVGIHWHNSNGTIAET